MTNIANRLKSLAADRTAEWLDERTAYMESFLTEERKEVLRRTLASRTRYMTILTENTFHPQNASALVRHCEAFGVQELHTVETRCKFNPNVNIVRGTDKWVDITRHDSTADAISAASTMSSPSSVTSIALRTASTIFLLSKITTLPSRFTTCFTIYFVFLLFSGWSKKRTLHTREQQR